MLEPGHAPGHRVIASGISGKPLVYAAQNVRSGLVECGRVVILSDMDYELFRAAWEEARHAVRLKTIGFAPRETLDVRTLDRIYEVYVEPLGGQDAPPFHVTATLSWRWTKLNTVRGTLCDEDVLTEMLGREQSANLVSEHPIVRVDIELGASAPYDNPLPMPSQQRWQRWSRETLERLQSMERLLPEETARENAAGRLEVLARS